MTTIKVSSDKKQELIDITSSINDVVAKSGIESGICHVYALHATAGIVVNENYDPNICLDFLDALNKAFPDNAGYRHDQVDGNAGAHIKAALIGPGEVIPVEGRKLKLGTWQSIMLVELDGPKTRRNIEIKILKS